MLLLLLFIRSPWGQGIIVDRLVSYISNKTNTTVAIDRLFITFSGDISLEGLYMEDKEGDTLVYSRHLEADIPLMPLIKGKGISIDNLDWSGVRANIKRQDTIEGYNYQFLMDAFISPDTSSTAADTTSGGMSIKLGDLELNDFKINFNDRVAGIESNFMLGKLDVQMQQFALDKMTFDMGDAVLENTRFSYSQTKPFPENKDQESSPMPSFSVKNLKISNVYGDYQSIPDGLLADIGIDDLILELPEANLKENKIIIERFRLKDSNILIQTAATSARDIVPSETQQEKQAFEWPDWNILAEEITLVDNHLQFLTEGETPQKGVFNPKAIELASFALQANHLAY